uniref:Opsin 1 (cone pigments), short-wave-sensitive 1 n=1 Tax=Sinocyclocheilus grahami TaxID=75366 RepID=A0A672JYT6_SINGR
PEDDLPFHLHLPPTFHTRQDFEDFIKGHAISICGLSTAFMGFVFFVGVPLNTIVIFPLNYILYSSYFLGHTLCAMESAMGSIAGKTEIIKFSIILNFNAYIICNMCECFIRMKIYFTSLSCFRIYPQIAGQQAESASTQKAEKEVSRVVIVMVGSYIVCYGPYAISAMCFAYADDANKDYRLVAIPALFLKSSCMYNPLIYAFLNKQFNACIMETVFGKKIDECSEVSSKTETSSVSA